MHATGPPTDIGREPMTDTKSVTHATAAAEAVRALNHASRGDLVLPGDVASIVMDLQLTLQNMPQALAQVTSWLTHRAAEGAFYDDRGRAIDPVTTAQSVTAQAVQAEVHCRRAASMLQIAAEHLTHLGSL
jgi:hypothetical protein